MAIKLEKLTRSRLLHVTLSTLEGLKEYTGVKDLPMSAAVAFLQVALRGETPQADLVKLTDSSKSSVSRSLILLSQPGSALLEVNEDALMRSRKLVKLAPAGQELIETILTTLNRGVKEHHDDKAERSQEDMAN